MTVKVGDFVTAEYVSNLYGTRATLTGVVTSVAEPHTRFNASDHRAVSVKRPDGSEGTSQSTLPVTVIHSAGHPVAQEATRQLLASGAWLNSRAEAALKATL